MAKIRKLVIPAAGLGTRGLPFTKEIPKEMLPIIDTPTLQLIVEEAVSAGIEQVILVTSKGKSAMEDYFDPSPYLEQFLRSKGKNELADKVNRLGHMVEVLSVRQKEPKGLGHAVLCAKPLVGSEPFAVCLGDEIFAPWAKGGAQGLKNLVKAAEATNRSVIGVLKVPEDEICHYGAVDAGGKEFGATTPVSIRGTVEKPSAREAPSLYAIIGRYAFQPEIFDALERLSPKGSSEIQLTDAMNSLAKLGKLDGMLFTDRRYDIGNHLYYVLAQVDSALHRPELSAKIRPLIQKLLEEK
jgi:UTP--glucose-1-phosphate uridylyltransferase